MGPGDRVRLGLKIEPLDTLFFRGGRPFGPATRAEGGLPQPQTLAGALRTALLAAHGFDFGAFAQRRSAAPAGEAVAFLLKEAGAPEGLIETSFRGPWLTREPGAAPCLPMPANLFRDRSGTWCRADPLAERLPGWKAPQPGRLPLWHRGAPDSKRPDGFLTPQGIATFLQGGVPNEDDWVKPDDLYVFDDRTGLEIDADTLTGVEGRLFATRRLALMPKVCFYAEALVPTHAVDALKSRLSDPLPFPWGGEGRYAVARLRAPPVAWPSGGPSGVGTLWLLATSGLFARPGIPDSIPDMNLAAIASGPMVAVSGWDVARGVPRPTRFAAPAGSVYFANNADESTGADPMSLCADPEDRAQGWGFALRGVWNDA